MTATVVAGRGIVTPQGVVLDLETAGVGYRAMARLIDLAVLAGIGGTLSLLARTLLPSTAANVVGLLVAVIVFFGYPAFSETYFRGRTIGKMAFGLRVVTLEAGPIGFYEAFIRSIFQIIDIGTFGVAALLCGMVTDRSQRVGDVAAGTFVIRDPKSLAHVPAVPFTPPMGTEAIVASLDVSKLKPHQERVIRSFLLRVGELSGDARIDLGQRLAQSTALRLGHDPNRIGPPETYLATVMAARQMREGGLAQLAMDRPIPKRRFRRNRSR